MADPSNHDDRYDRARLRKRIEGSDLLDAHAVARSALLLGEAEAALDAAVEILADVIVFGDATAVFRPARLTPELQRRLALRCLRHVDPALEPRGSAVARAVVALAEGRSASLGTVLAQVELHGDAGPVWRFVRAPRRRAS